MRKYQWTKIIMLLVVIFVSCTTYLMYFQTVNSVECTTLDPIVRHIRKLAQMVPTEHRTVDINSHDIEEVLMMSIRYFNISHEAFKNNVNTSSNRKFKTTPVSIMPKTVSTIQLQMKETSHFSYYVCPEVYGGSKYGYPYYHKGFITTNCTWVKPLNTLITIFINHIHGSNFSKAHFRRVLKGIRTNYESVPVHVAVSESVSEAVLNQIREFNATFKKYETDVSEGKLLNKLHLGIVETPFVLIARDLNHFSFFSPLDRAIRVLSETKNVKIVAGAFRNETAHWKVGCYQTISRNYALKYIEGYHKSKNECMFCDHVSGSFFTFVSTIKNRPFDETLPSALLYADWFMELRLDGHSIITCPDIMFFQSGRDVLELTPEKKTWKPLAKKWEFDLIIHPQKQLLYTCAEISLNCDAIDRAYVKEYMRPPCCIRVLADSLKSWQEYVNKHGIACELDTGFALGVVKTNGITPWDIDGDMAFKVSEFFDIYLNRSELRIKGVNINFQAPTYSKSGNMTSNPYMRMNAGGVPVEFFSDTNITGELFLPKELNKNQTVAQFLGNWINTPANPGMFARNRYGYNCLRHSPSWLFFKENSDSFSLYHPEKFHKCSKPRHHSCLDKYSIDGNIQFQRN